MKRNVLLLVAMLLCSFSFARYHDSSSKYQNYYEGLNKKTFNSNGSKNALVYIYYSHTNDFAIEALEAQNYSVFVANDLPEFDTELATGNYSFAIVLIQEDCEFPDYSTLQNFINGSGKVIFNDWTMDGYFTYSCDSASFTEDYAALFEAQYTYNINCMSFTFTDPFLAFGITNPVILTNPGWGDPKTMGLTPIGSGVSLAKFDCNIRSYEDALILGNNGNTIILGYFVDQPLFGERQQLFENLIVYLENDGNPPPVTPVNNWALIFGIFLITVFIIVNYRRRLA